MCNDYFNYKLLDQYYAEYRIKNTQRHREKLV